LDYHECRPAPEPEPEDEQPTEAESEGEGEEEEQPEAAEDAEEEADEDGQGVVDMITMATTKRKAVSDPPLLTRHRRPAIAHASTRARQRQERITIPL